MQKPEFDSMSDARMWVRAMIYLRKRDKHLGKVIKRVGPIEMKLRTDKYETLIHSFVNQQISGAAADSILRKFKGIYANKLPTPLEFLKTPEKKVRSVGLSPQKYSYIKSLCEKMQSGDLDLESLGELPDEEVIAILDDLKGVGRWTAEMFLMFSLGRVNVFPADDLGIANATQRIYGLKVRPKPKKLDEMAKKWEPYKSVATMYLWRSIEPDPSL